MSVRKYRKKPIVIEALQWTGSNAEEMAAFAGSRFGQVPPEDRAEDPLRTAEVWDELHGTWIGLRDGQWVIKGIRGEFYPHDESAFAEVYKLAEDAEDAPAAGTHPLIAVTYDGDTYWLECFEDDPDAEHGEIICPIDAGDKFFDLAAQVDRHIVNHGC
jgi:hypothetical protein